MNLLTVAIQGDQASFHEIAAYKHYQEPIKLIYCQTFDEVFEKLAKGDAHKAFVAVRNSAHGEICEVKQLIENNAFEKESEYSLRIEQHLIGLHDATLDTVKRVVSHPVALSQCDTYLSGYEQQEYYDTSAAVEYVKKQGNASLAAIGSEAAAKLHGLKIIKRSIQNEVNNTTVFASLYRNFTL